MQKGINTVLLLNQDYVVVQDVKGFTLTAPDGFAIEHRMALSVDMKKLFKHSGVLIEKIVTERKTDVRVFEIEGIEVRKEANNRLLIHSDNYKEAVRKYDRVKKSLIEDGYIIESKECKQVGDCEERMKRLTEF